MRNALKAAWLQAEIHSRIHKYRYSSHHTAPLRTLARLVPWPQNVLTASLDISKC